MSITVEDVMGLGPCYSRERVEALFGHRAAVSPADIAAAPISADDRVWLLLRLAPRECWLPAVYRAAERAIRYVCWALHSAGLHDDAEELACASPMIDSPVAARDAALAASAARDTAWAARAAGDAVWAAARAAGDAERQLFVDDLATCLDAPAAGGGR